MSTSMFTFSRVFKFISNLYLDFTFVPSFSVILDNTNFTLNEQLLILNNQLTITVKVKVRVFRLNSNLPNNWLIISLLYTDISEGNYYSWHIKHVYQTSKPERILPSNLIPSFTDNICSICIMDDEDYNILFLCGHFVCLNCYEKLTICPYCRAVITDSYILKSEEF